MVRNIRTKGSQFSVCHESKLCEAFNCCLAYCTSCWGTWEGSDRMVVFVLSSFRLFITTVMGRGRRCGIYTCTPTHTHARMHPHPPGLRAWRVQFCSNQAKTVRHNSSWLPVDTVLLYDSNSCCKIMLYCTHRIEESNRIWQSSRCTMAIYITYTLVMQQKYLSRIIVNCEWGI